MKYIKKFETISWSELYNIHFLFYHFLNKIKIKENDFEFIVTPLYYDTSYKDVPGYIVGFQIRYKYRNDSVATTLLFTIRVTSSKYSPGEDEFINIYLDNSKPIDFYTSKEYIWNIINFLKEKFSKYAIEKNEFENKLTKYTFDKSQIDTIVKELYDDYELQMDMKKFNM